MPMETVPYVKKPWLLFTGLAILFFSLVIGTCIVGANLRWFKEDDALTAGIIASIVGLITVVALLSSTLAARRTEKLLERGFHLTPSTSRLWGSRVSLSPPAEAALRAHSELMRQGYFSFAAVREEAEHEFWVLRHVIPRGKYSEFHCAIIRTHKQAWPRVTIHKRGVSDMFKSLFKTKPVKIEKSFDRKVAVWSDNAEFAVLLMSPELRAICRSLKSDQQIVVDHQGVSFIRRSMPMFDGSIPALDKTEAIIAAIPPELAAWEPEPTIDSDAVPH